ncbi:hypothetical protein Barb4_00258 [Bacteroidales bacterium Barb4]|nr:hypothetical protein Barb4_00258 [Bacteroidales bacterium Barb4]
MAYESVDKLQKVLADDVFKYTKDPKKAAGRTLGTLVEVITYYLLKTWGFNNQISIERGLEEYGNPDITHNVEYALHPTVRNSTITIDKSDKLITANIVLKALEAANFDLNGLERKSNNLLSNGILRNACTIAASDNSFLLTSIKTDKGDTLELHVYEQSKKPYVIFECKRVGIEEGMSKGPQTIEKAKQGAYVARTASSLQKIRTETGELHGIIYKSNGSYIIKPFVDLMEEVVYSNDKELLRRFILTVGIVSNHGNWFTSENPNKELKVLVQSYDWLLFLTDKGLSEFIDHLLLNPPKEQKFIREVFLSSYTEGKTKNQFTKVQMNLEANRLLLDYFNANLKAVESWFNIISPNVKKLSDLKSELSELTNKDWAAILK